MNTFSIYCDESTHLRRDGKPFMLLGAISVPNHKIKEYKRDIRAIIQKHNYNEELKWVNVHSATSELYKELVDYFFNSQMNFRSVIVNKSEINTERDDYEFRDFYYKMYYQLLRFMTSDIICTYDIYFDKQDTRSHRKLQNLRGFLRCNLGIRNFQFVNSYESIFIQLADILIGAVNYSLRIDSGDIQGSVIAKRDIVTILKRNADISCTSKLSEKKFNLFFISLKK